MNMIYGHWNVIQTLLGNLWKSVGYYWCRLVSFSLSLIFPAWCYRCFNWSLPIILQAWGNTTGTQGSWPQYSWATLSALAYPISSYVMKTLYTFLVTCCKIYFLMDTEGEYYEFIYIDKEIEASLFYSYRTGTWQITNGKNLKKRKNQSRILGRHRKFI